MSEEQLDKCRVISELVDTKPAKDDWQWWVVFKSAKIKIPDTLNSELIFGDLNALFQSVCIFENNLKAKLEYQ